MVFSIAEPSWTAAEGDDDASVVDDDDDDVWTMSKEVQCYDGNKAAST